MTLIVTLNHNQGKLTDNLVEQLYQGDQNKFDIWVIDNGSMDHEKSKYTTHETGENLYFGGGFNYVLKKFLKQDKYDYLWFLNNDLIFTGYNLVEIMENEAENGEYDMLSPAITNSHTNPCHWRQMWCWNTEGTRDAKWLDLQAPLLSKRLCKEIEQFPEELHLGWGLDFYSGLLCEDKGWNIGVTDLINFVHLDSKTLKDGKVMNYTLNEFCRDAGVAMERYFVNTNKFDTDRYKSYRKWGESYSPEDFILH